MEILINCAIGLLCLSQLAIGLIWTNYCYETASDSEIKIKLCAPILIFALALIGHFAWGILTLIDNHAEIDTKEFFYISASITALGAVFLFKNLIAPLFLMLATAWSTYMYLTYGIAELVPVYDFILEVLLFWAPNWMQVTYVWGSMVYLLIGSVVSLMN